MAFAVRRILLELPVQENTNTSELIPRLSTVIKQLTSIAKKVASRKRLILSMALENKILIKTSETM